MQMRKLQHLMLLIIIIAVSIVVFGQTQKTEITIMSEKQNYHDKILQTYKEQKLMTVNENVRIYADYGFDMCVKYNMSFTLFRYICEIESGWKATAKSVAEARGILQLMLPTANYINSQIKIKDKIYIRDLYDYKINIELGVALLSLLWKEYNGNLYKICVAYNAGPRYLTNKKDLPNETKWYILKLYNLMDKDNINVNNLKTEIYELSIFSLEWEGTDIVRTCKDFIRR